MKVTAASLSRGPLRARTPQQATNVTRLLCIRAEPAGRQAFLRQRTPSELPVLLGFTLADGRRSR